MTSFEAIQNDKLNHEVAEKGNPGGNNHGHEVVSVDLPQWTSGEGYGDSSPYDLKNVSYEGHIDLGEYQERKIDGLDEVIVECKTSIEELQSAYREKNGEIPKEIQSQIDVQQIGTGFSFPGNSSSTEEGVSAPFVIGAKEFRDMTPEQSVSLAGRMVQENHDKTLANENLEISNEFAVAEEENMNELESIKAEMLALEESRIAKYGPEDTWPVEVRQEQEKQRIGWGFLAASALTAVAGSAISADANARGNGWFEQQVANYVSGEVQRANQQDRQSVNHENRMDQIELNIQQRRYEMEMRFQDQANQKNLNYQRELSRARSASDAQRIQQNQDADWNAFVNSIQIQRARFEARANADRDRQQVNLEGQQRNIDASQRAQVRQAIGGGINNVLRGRR